MVGSGADTGAGNTLAGKVVGVVRWCSNLMPALFGASLAAGGAQGVGGEH